MRHDATRLVAGLALVGVLCSPMDAQALRLWGGDDDTATQATYTYVEKDADEERKQYRVKLEQDKRKCELAIINTKTLINRSRNRPYLSELYLRLAELYIEKSRIAFFLRKSQQEDEQALDQYESNLLKKQALEIYQRILDQDPDFRYIDKVYFFMAHEYYELGQVDEMIKQYQVLVSRYPNSQYAPEAQLLLGDYYFNQEKDVDQSIRHYEAVLNYPQSPAVAAARYKLGWCRINQLDFNSALRLFEQSVSGPLAYKDLDIDTYRRVDVRLESLVDMAYCYPEVHKQATPEQALAYFRQYAWSRPVYSTVLEKLANRYYIKKKWAMAAPLYRELATIRQDPQRLLEYARHLFDCVQAQGTYRYAQKDVAIIVRALNHHVTSAHMTEAQKEELVNDYELYARDIITHLHARARQTSATGDFGVVADAYEQYLDFFDDSQAVEKMAANYAEALFSAGRYLEAGRQYEQITPAATVDTHRRGEMLYSAVISYYRALKNKDHLNFYQAAYAREGLRSSGKIYAGEYPQSRQTPDVLFNVAWASYDDGHYDVAISDLTTFVDAYPGHPATTAAIHLIMDAYHLQEDYDGMIRFGTSILAGRTIRDDALRQEINQLVRGAESKVVSGMTVAAMEDWENTRRELIDVADRSDRTAMGEQALNALIISSREQKDLATFFDAGNKLISSYPNSPRLQDTVGMLIDTTVNIGQLRLLADYLEIQCQKFPDHNQNGDFLLQAARIREGLGQPVEANQNYRQLLIHHPAGISSWDDIVFSMVDNADGNADAAQGILDAHLNRLSAAGRVRAHARMAVIALDADRLSRGNKYAAMAQKAYRPDMGRQDPVLRDLMAELAYRRVVGSSGPYFKIRLGKQIDNKRVEKKIKKLEELEKGYQRVMGFNSPAWALKACFRANELYAEFADFLLASPIPDDLAVEQKAQYRDLIRQKAQAYRDKSDTYRDTCVELARKWEICDPDLAGYFHSVDPPTERTGQLTSLAGRQVSVRIGSQGLRDQVLSSIYSRLLSTPEDLQLQLELARAYMQAGDFNQSMLVAKNAIPKLGGSQPRLEAELLNLIGVAHLYGGKDPLAKDTFKRALVVDDHLDAARVNLAGLYRHYGHTRKAAELVKTVSPAGLDPGAVHPRAGALYNEYAMVGQ